MLFFAKVRRQQGQLEDALALLTSCREIFRSVSSGGYVAYSDLVIGILHNERGEHDQAADNLQHALTFAQALGDPRWQAYVLLNLAVTARARGWQDEARRDLEQSLAMFQQAGDGQGTSYTRQLIASFGETAVLRS